MGPYSPCPIFVLYTCQKDVIISLYFSSNRTFPTSANAYTDICLSDCRLLIPVKQYPYQALIIHFPFATHAMQAQFSNIPKVFCQVNGTQTRGVICSYIYLLLTMAMWNNLFIRKRSGSFFSDWNQNLNDCLVI